MTSSNDSPEIAPGTLKAVKDSFKRDDLILSAVHRHVMRKAVEEDDDERSPWIIHPSEVAKGDEWCPTHDYYRLTGTETGGHARSASFRMESIYDYGHSIHRKWQGWLQEMNSLWGLWKCKACGIRWYDLSPAWCPQCDSDHIVYREVPMYVPDLLLGGHADGVIWLPDKPRLLEVKSIGINTLRFEAPKLWQQYQDGHKTLDQVWWSITRPLGSHIRQALQYLYMAPLCHSELQQLDEVIFIYEWKPNQDAKELVLKFDATLFAPILLDIREVAAAVRQGTPPPRPSWADKNAKNCKSCPYRKTCWSVPDDQPPAEAPVRVQRVAGRTRSKALRRSPS